MCRQGGWKRKKMPRPDGGETCSPVLTNPLDISDEQSRVCSPPQSPPKVNNSNLSASSPNQARKPCPIPRPLAAPHSPSSVRPWKNNPASPETHFSPQSSSLFAGCGRRPQCEISTGTKPNTAGPLMQPPLPSPPSPPPSAPGLSTDGGGFQRY